MMRRLVIIGMLSWQVLSAQQDPMFNQYIFNSFTINAAEAGTRSIGTASILHRWQWLGMEGAPKTLSAGFESPIGLSGWGVGLNIVSDEQGPERNQTVTLAGSHHIEISETYTLSAGLSFVANGRRLNFGELKDIYDPDDPELSTVRTFNPNVGGGLLLFSASNFIGAAVPRIVEYRLSEADRPELHQLRHLFVYAGHIFEVNHDFWIKPSVLFKFVQGAPTGVDVNAVVHFLKKFDLGVNFRTGDGIGFLAGFNIKDRLIVNYAYEVPITNLRYGSLKSHEIGIRYLFGKGPDHAVDSPRFFN